MRIDAPSANNVQLGGLKRWPKLVMAVRSESELQSWIAAVRSAVGAGNVESAVAAKFDPPQQRLDNMVVFAGTALKEVRARIACSQRLCSAT
jgi:hypothetical protein